MDQKISPQNNQGQLGSDGLSGHDPRQLDLESFAFRLAQAEFIESSAMARESDSYLLPADAQRAQKRFFGYSLALHGLLALSVMTAAITQQEEKPLSETISFEIIDSGSPADLPQALMPMVQSPAVQTHAKPAPAAPAKMAVASVKSSAAASAASTQAKPLMTVTESPVIIPETLDDISAPELDQQAQAEAQKVNRLDENEIDSKLAAAAISTEDLNKTRNDFDKTIADESEKSLALLNDFEKKSQADAAQMAKANELNRLQEQKMIAGLMAQEQAAKSEAAARAVALGRGEGGGKGSGSTQGDGPVNASAVRDLEDLRQMPGNPRPEYSVQDRMDRLSGTVIFWAYIGKDGGTSKFKLLQSSGHRSLDGKTLAALKKWKFYPGQEGWVELPFKWDIEGGVQEKPTMLRRSNK